MSMLEDAARVSDAVDGERNADYGHPLQNFATIAALWSAAFGREFSREDVALAMILLKVARLCGPQQTHRDSWVDIAGYVNCVDAIHEANGAPKMMEELTRQYMREHQAERQEQVRERHDIVPDERWTLESAITAARDGDADAREWLAGRGLHWDDEAGHPWYVPADGEADEIVPLTMQADGTYEQPVQRPPDRPADGRPSIHNCPSGANCRNGCGLGPCPMESNE